MVSPWLYGGSATPFTPRSSRYRCTVLRHNHLESSDQSTHAEDSSLLLTLSLSERSNMPSNKVRQAKMPETAYTASQRALDNPDILDTIVLHLGRGALAKVSSASKSILSAFARVAYVDLQWSKYQTFCGLKVSLPMAVSAGIRGVSMTVSLADVLPTALVSQGPEDAALCMSTYYSR